MSLLSKDRAGKAAQYIADLQNQEDFLVQIELIYPEKKVLFVRFGYTAKLIKNLVWKSFWKGGRTCRCLQRSGGQRCVAVKGWFSTLLPPGESHRSSKRHFFGHFCFGSKNKVPDCGWIVVSWRISNFGFLWQKIKHCFRGSSPVVQNTRTRLSVWPVSCRRCTVVVLLIL